MKLEGLFQGKNSVLYGSESESVLYEKLSNTIHRGRREELKKLQDKIEQIEHNPAFESETLKEKRNNYLEGLVLNITESCNFNCSYCIFSGNYLGERNHNSSKMDFETAKKGIDLFLPHSTDPALISFYGGEPLINMNLIKEVIDYTLYEYPSKNSSFSMTTNFYDADKHFEDIVKRNINLLVSLDGPKEIHDGNRIHQNGRPTWNKIIENLHALERYSPGYLENYVGASVTCVKTENLEKIVKFFLEESPIRLFRIGGIETKGLKDKEFKKALSNTTSQLSSEFLDYVTKEKIIPDVYRLLFEQQLTLMTMRSKNKLPEQIKLAGSCYPGNRKLFVDTDGKLYMCEKFGRRMPIGDVNEGINHVLIEDAIDEFTNIRNNVCTNNCWAQRICTPCIQSAKDVEGEISEKGLIEMCKNFKLNLLTTIEIYSQISQLDVNYLDEINMAHAQLNK